MAQQTFASLTTALSTIIDPKSIAQMNRAAVLSTILPFEQGAGQNLAWNAVFGLEAPVDATIAEGADVATFESDNYVPAVLQWGSYATAFSITGKAMAAAKTSGQDLSDQCQVLLEQGINRLARAINRDLYVGAGTGNLIAGLIGGNALGVATSYAGLSRVTYPQWKSNVKANGGTPWPTTGGTDIQTLMRDMTRLIYEASGESVDAIVTSPIQHEKYGLSLGANRRYVQQVNLRGNVIVLDAGYTALEFDGIPVFKDVDCPADAMIFLNTKYVKLRQLPSGPCCFQNGDGPGYIRLHGSQEEQTDGRMSQLTARLKVLSAGGDYCRVALFLYPQLQVKRPNANGVIRDLPIT